MQLPYSEELNIEYLGAIIQEYNGVLQIFLV